MINYQNESNLLSNFLSIKNLINPTFVLFVLFFFGFWVQMKNSIAIKIKITQTVGHSHGVTKSKKSYS